MPAKMSEVTRDVQALSVHLDKKLSMRASRSLCMCLAVVMQPPSEYLM